MKKYTFVCAKLLWACLSEIENVTFYAYLPNHTLTNLILGIYSLSPFIIHGRYRHLFLPKVLLSNNNLFLGSNLLLVSFPWGFQVCRSMCDQISGCCCCSINEPDFPLSPQNCTLQGTSTSGEDIKYQVSTRKSSKLYIACNKYQQGKHIRKTSELVNIWGPFTETNKD